MAIYHLSVKPIGRATGRSATGAAAYRAGMRIMDTRTGEIHDYTRKGGIERHELTSQVILPGGGHADRTDFWNQIEHHHKRGDAILCREVVVALPAELDQAQRLELAAGFARELADRYQVAADVAIHKPGKDGDDRNHHSHILLSACHVQPDGTLGKKAEELDPIHCQRRKIENMADRERVRWEGLANGALARAGYQERIDHRTLAAQGIDRLPTCHLGPSAMGFERRTGQASQIRESAAMRSRLSAQERRRREALNKEIEDMEKKKATLAQATKGMAGAKEKIAKMKAAAADRARLEQDIKAQQERKRLADEAARLKDQQQKDELAKKQQQPKPTPEDDDGPTFGM